MPGQHMEQLEHSHLKDYCGRAIRLVHALLSHQRGDKGALWHCSLATYIGFLLGTLVHPRRVFPIRIVMLPWKHSNMQRANVFSDES